MKKLLFIALFAALFACQKSEITNGNPSLVKNVWVNDGWKGDTVIYRNQSDFEKDTGGYQFKKNGKLVSRQNASFCGTPPITYENYGGSWLQIAPDTLSINAEYWGTGHNMSKELLTYKFYIISIDDNTLKLSYVK